MQPSGWSCLRSLIPRIKNRLKPLNYHCSDSHDGRPSEMENTAELICIDLETIFVEVNLIIDRLSTHGTCGELDQASVGLLSSLNKMVNREVIQPRREFLDPGFYFLGKSGNGDSNDRSFGDVGPFDKYPALDALICFLDTTTDKFDLLGDPATSLLTLPDSQTRSSIEQWIEVWKDLLLADLRSDTKRLESFQALDGSDVILRTTKPKQQVYWQDFGRSGMVDAIFTAFKKSGCDFGHEIKLRVPDNYSMDSQGQTLDMFMSYCPNGDVWHEAQCEARDSIPTDQDNEESICSALQRSFKLKRKMILHIDQRGLFDISDKRPPVSTSWDEEAWETMDSLLESKFFNPPSAKYYETGATFESLSLVEKTSIALSLARCFMDLVTPELDPQTWDPKRIFFKRSPNAQLGGRKLYLSLSQSGVSNPNTAIPTTVMTNPMAVSFAELMIHIHEGKGESIGYPTQDNDKWAVWVKASKYVEWKLKHETSYYFEAIFHCLSLAVHFRKHQQSCEGDPIMSLRDVIRENIVENLQRALDSQTPKRKRRSDVSELPQAKRLGNSNPSQTRSRVIPTTFIEGRLDQGGSSHGEDVNFGSKYSNESRHQLLTVERQPMLEGSFTSVLHSQRQELSMDQGSQASIRYEYDISTVALYDDRDEGDTHMRKRAQDYFDHMTAYTARYIMPCVRRREHEELFRSKRRIRIALIDSGVDMGDTLLRNAANRIKEQRNWTDSDPTNCHDTYGHGTHVARLALRVAPAADICIAKVSSEEIIKRNETYRIAEAIIWAAEKWDADIISMSLGLQGEDRDIEQALDSVLDPPAGKRKRIVIAACGNRGSNLPRAYPANRRGVIPMYATDGYGNSNGINPDPQAGHNFATLGVGVYSRWKGQDVWKSGTSFSTPIAAAIAANVLEFAEHNIQFSSSDRDRLYSTAGMAQIFHLMSSLKGEYHYLKPWSLFSVGRDCDEICKIIRDCIVY